MRLTWRHVHRAENVAHASLAPHPMECGKSNYMRAGLERVRLDSRASMSSAPRSKFIESGLAAPHRGRTHAW